MDRSPTAAVPPSTDWLLRKLESTRIAPVWLGLGIAALWLLVVGLAHVAGHLIFGPSPLPFGPAPFAWTIVVNATLVGLIVAGHAHLHRCAIADLERLRPLLPDDEAEFARLRRELPDPTPAIRVLATTLGAVGGLAVATLDPTLRAINEHLQAADPRYLVFLLQNILFGALGTRLFVAEVHLTRAYARLGERVAVDLFDQSMLLLFARKGLRSVVVWVLISSAFSMFWVLDSAGQANVLFPIGVLALVALALIGPTRGIHQRIVAAKTHELDRVIEAIRIERDAALAPRRPDAPNADARLGNLVQYYEFVSAIREWPFDLSIVTRTVLVVALGVGSWLGGAVVERLLGLVLD